MLRCVGDSKCEGSSDSRVVKFVTSPTFDILVSFIILIQTASMGLQIELWATGWTAKQLSDFNTLNALMSLCFYLEITLRAYAYHPSFHKFVNNNILDTLVIAFLFCADVYCTARQKGGWT